MSMKFSQTNIVVILSLIVYGCPAINECNTIYFEELSYDAPIIIDHNKRSYENEELVNKIIDYHYNNPYKFDDNIQVKKIEFVSKTKSEFLFSAIQYTDLYFIYTLDSNNCPSERSVYSPL